MRRLYAGAIDLPYVMKLFVLFIVLCFVGGLLFWKVPLGRRQQVLLVVCLFISFAYFFLNQL